MSWRIQKGDCLSVMRGMDSSSVDHIICDPPYDAKTHAGVMTMKGGAAGEVQLGFEALSTMAHVKEMLRVAKGWVIAFCSLEQLGEYAMYAGDAWVRAGAWDRVNGAPQLSGDRPAQGADGVALMWAGKIHATVCPDIQTVSGMAIMWAGKDRMAWNGGGSRAMWRVPRATDGNHPTEKPILLMQQLVRQFTDYGDTVLDPFMGSGTTGVACVQLGRNFIGCEMLDKHLATAKVRLSAANEQPDLPFGKRKKQKQLKLLEATDVKEEDEEDQAQGLPDHGVDGQAEVSQVPVGGEATGQADDGRHSGVDRRDAVGAEEESRSEESDPFEEGPEVEDLGEAQEFPEEDGEADAERDRGW